MIAYIGPINDMLKQMRGRDSNSQFQTAGLPRSHRRRGGRALRIGSPQFTSNAPQHGHVEDFVTVAPAPGAGQHDTPLDGISQDAIDRSFGARHVALSEEKSRVTSMAELASARVNSLFGIKSKSQ